ncbi:putative signal transduction protein Syg1 [Phyllosticta citricarpa]
MFVFFGSPRSSDRTGSATAEPEGWGARAPRGEPRTGRSVVAAKAATTTDGQNRLGFLFFSFLCPRSIHFLLAFKLFVGPRDSAALTFDRLPWPRMKFAKELERELVPEWRAKYLNYKLGKKKLKAISRALRNATQQTPRDPPKRLAHSAPVTSAHALHRADIKDVEPSDDTNEDAGGAKPRDIPGSPPLRSRGGHLSSLALPDPAIDPDAPDAAPDRRRGSSASPPTTPKRQMLPRQHSSSAIPPPRTNSQGNFKGIFQAKKTYISPVTEGSRVQLKKVLSLGTTAVVQDADVPLEAYKDIDTRQQEFFQFLDQELEKIETFYREKEDEATKRLVVLREQLHSMRDRRLEEITSSRSHRTIDQRQQAAATTLVGPNLENDEAESKIWPNPLDAVVQAAKKIPDKIAHSRAPSKASNSIADLGTPRQFHDRRDYTRRQEPTTVPYRTAKRKLKVALQEYYRGLELLKSYALLNRTAFRKINKKYDKTVNARPAMRYMTEKVNKAWFVKSDVIENYIHATEDLYARPRERATTPIRRSATASSWQRGLCLASKGLSKLLP